MHNNSFNNHTSPSSSLRYTTILNEQLQ